MLHLDRFQRHKDETTLDPPLYQRVIQRSLQFIGRHVPTAGQQLQPIDQRDPFEVGALERSGCQGLR